MIDNKEIRCNFFFFYEFLFFQLALMVATDGSDSSKEAFYVSISFSFNFNRWHLNFLEAIQIYLFAMLGNNHKIIIRSFYK